MALVVLLRGVNVGGHRTFRPSQLVGQLRHLDVVNIGAAGTFVVRKSISQGALRREVAARLPFEAEIIICQGSEVLALMSRDFSDRVPGERDLVRFVSVLARRSPASPAIPLDIPATGPWQVRIVALEKRFAVGVYRRQMRAVSHLGALDRLLGVPVTTRNWNTMGAIEKVLRG